MKKVISVFMLTAITAAPAFAAASSSHPPHPGHAPIAGEAPGVGHSHTKTMKYHGKPVDPRLMNGSLLNTQRVADNIQNAVDKIERFDGTKESEPVFEKSIQAFVNLKNKVNTAITDRDKSNYEEVRSEKRQEIMDILGVSKEALDMIDSLPAPNPKDTRLKEQHLYITGKLLDCTNVNRPGKKKDCTALHKAAANLSKSIRDLNPGAHMPAGPHHAQR